MPGVGFIAVAVAFVVLPKQVADVEQPAGREDAVQLIDQSPLDIAVGDACQHSEQAGSHQTSLPDGDVQGALVDELNRVLAPGGLLYVSDLLWQDDERNRDRYEAHALQFGTPYGVFATDDGAVCRHHDIAELRTLLSDFDLVDERRIEVATMNGHGRRRCSCYREPVAVTATR